MIYSDSGNNLRLSSEDSSYFNINTGYFTDIYSSNVESNILKGNSVNAKTLVVDNIDGTATSTISGGYS
jgi:hypothetical protein